MSREDLMILVAILLKRQGGQVTITQAELEDVSRHPEITATKSRSFQDDTITVRVVERA